jgi:hypothetical protein
VLAVRARAKHRPAGDRASDSGLAGVVGVSGGVASRDARRAGVLFLSSSLKVLASQIQVLVFCRGGVPVPAGARQRDSLLPDAGNRQTASRTVTVLEAIDENIVPGAANQHGVALRAGGVRAVAEDIAFIDVMQAGFERDFAGAVQSFRRSGRLVHELEIGMERGEVQRHIRAEMREDPFGELAGFGGIVIERGNHEIGEFKPHGGFIFEPLEGFENGLEMRERDFSVELLGEGFEVHVGRVNVGIDIPEGFMRDVAVGDHDGFEAVRLGGAADVNDVLAPDGGLVVGEGEGVAAVLESQKRHIFRRNRLRVNLVLAGFGNIPVLAEEAAHVASGRAHAEDARAGQEMIEGLFLDGINLQSGGSAVAEAVEFAVAIDADEAKAGLSGMNVAMAGTEIAVDFAAGFGLPPESFVERLGFLEDLKFRHGSSSFGVYIREEREG